MIFRPTTANRRGAFTLMEILVVIAIVIILAAIGLPVYSTIQKNANKAAAINKLRQLGAALGKFAGEHDGALPAENAPGKDSWNAAADPANANVWYNALPRAAGVQGVGDYARNPASFYQKDNLLFLRGAKYSESRLVEPQFAIAINSRLQRRDKTGTGQKGEMPAKPEVKLGSITQAARTVIFFERGLKGEEKAAPTQPKYDGAAKGNGRAFVARYSGRGLVLFLDGHTESLTASDILDSAGNMIFPQTNIIWTVNPEENPNK